MYIFLYTVVVVVVVVRNVVLPPHSARPPRSYYTPSPLLRDVKQYIAIVLLIPLPTILLQYIAIHWVGWQTRGYRHVITSYQLSYYIFNF